LDKDLPAGYFGGICIGEGLAPVPEKLAARIKKGEFIEMCELIPEYWLAKKKDGMVKAEGQRLPSAEEQPQVISEYLALECCEGRVLGPLDPPVSSISYTGVNLGW